MNLNGKFNVPIAAHQAQPRLAPWISRTDVDVSLVAINLNNNCDNYSVSPAKYHF